MKNRSRLLFITTFFLTIIIGAGLAFTFTHAQVLTSKDLGLTPEVQSASGLSSTDIRITVARIIRVALGLLGIVAVGLALYGGFLWMTAGGNDDQIGQAKKVLVNSIIGLAIILSAFSIVSFVLNKLVDAINGAPADNNGGGGGINNPYFPNQAFYVEQLPAGGNMCVRNVHPIIVFNRNVVLDAGLQNNIAINRVSDGNIALGAWQYGDQKNIIQFVPNGDCGDGGVKDCLQPSTNYVLKFLDKTQIKAEGTDAQLVCGVNPKANCNNPINFTTGDNVDRVPPKVNIDYPDIHTPLVGGDVVPVKISYIDDNGVQNISLRADGYFVASQGIQGCRPTSTVTINWPTNGLNFGPHNLQVTGYDWAGASGATSTDVMLRPLHCYNGVKDGDETGIDVGGSCGAGAGSKCANDQDCASNYCENGFCVDRARIVDISPTSSAPGDFVTISGYYFGQKPGEVYFASTTNPTNSDWIKASLAQCPKAPQFSNWTPWQILVSAPNLPNGVSGPIKIITASTTVNGVERQFTDLTNDNFGPKINDFIFTKISRPGLCAVVPETAPPGALVSLFGQNLGTQGPNSAVLFDKTKTTVSPFTKNNNINWQTGQILEVPVPFLDPSILGITLFDNNGTKSNGLRFMVGAGVSNDTPLISSVTPNSGAGGEYITVTGKNFGNLLGQVIFYDRQDDKIFVPGSINFPKICADNLWSDSQIIIKFDKDQGIPGTNYIVRVVTADGKISPRDQNYSFTLKAGSPNPGICKIDPVSGPVPLAAGQHASIAGEYFGGKPEIYYWGIGANPNNLNARVLAKHIVTSTVGGAQLAFVDPNPGTITGPVVVRRTEDNTVSNPIKFTVNDCTKQDTCSVLGAYQCCASGLDAGLCKPNNYLCAGTTRATAYIWRFSTKDIISIPRVIERCNNDTDLGKNIPTPSPNLFWDKVYGGKDNETVCRNALVSIEFSTAMDQNTINSSQVVVNKCLSVDGNNCVVDNNAPPVLANTSFALRVSQGNQGGLQQYIQMSLDKGAPWQDNTFYQVVLRNGIKANGSSLALESSKPCKNDNNSAYCFVFKTDSQDCKIKTVVITPSAYWTQILEQPIKYRVINSDPGTVLSYYGNGLSTQKCIMMNMAGYDWNWQSASVNYANIFGPNDQVKASVSALANTVNIGLPNNSVDIKATASTSTLAGLISKTGASPLTIDLSNPEVFDYWPNCQEACTNADVGAQFTVAMSNYNVDKAARLYRCFDENCLATALVTTSTLPFINQGNRTFLSIPHDDLIPNALYQVILSGTTTPQQLWSQGSFGDPNIKGAPFNKIFSWRFGTKKEACKIDKVSIFPKQFIAKFLDDKSVYTVQPYSAPDSCDANGQKLNPWGVNWDWVSKDPSVAVVSTFSTVGKNPYCTASCVKSGSDVMFGATEPYPVCGNGVIEAGEDCDFPDAKKGCGLDCRLLGNQDKNTCGDGVVSSTLGEACDPKNASTTIGCSATCLHLGSEKNPADKKINASICGNGFIGSGEDCDLGIDGSIFSPTSSLGCSANCLHLGTRLSSKWCFDNNQPNKYGGFSKTDFNAACQSSYSQCGDGIVSPDEDSDCEPGKGQKLPTWCTNYCLDNDEAHSKPGYVRGKEGYNNIGQYSGSSLLYYIASVCGDGLDKNNKAGIGEDPFCEQNLLETHKGLVDPWTLATGVGQGPIQNVEIIAGTTTPAQATDIIGSTKENTKNGATKSGSGNFVIPCGYKSDLECQIARKSPDYGVGSDSCCYLKPKLIKTIPADDAANVCINTYIEASFNTAIDPVTLPGNLLIAHGTSGASNATPTPVYKGYLDAQKDPAALLSGATKVAVINNYAYVASNLSNAVEVVDVSVPTTPKHVTTLKGATIISPTTLIADQQYLYLAANNSFQIIDSNQADKTKPILLGSLTNGQVIKNNTARLSGSYHGIAADGNIIYVVSHDSGTIQSIDASDKKNLIPLASLGNGEVGSNGKVASLSGAVDISVSNNYAYVVGVGGVLQIIDVQNPAQLKPLGSLQGLGAMYSIVVKGDIAFIPSYGDNSLKVVDVKDKNKPVVIGTLANGANGARLSNPVEIKIIGNNAFITANDGRDKTGISGLEIINITTPSTPKHLASIDLKGKMPYGIAIDGDYAYVTTYGGGTIEIIDVADFGLFGSKACQTDVTNLISFVDKNLNEPWYQKLFTRITNFFRTLLGYKAEASNFPKPSRWCVGSYLGSAMVVNSITTTTSRVVVTLSQPLARGSVYAIIFKEGIKDIRGVSIGTSTIPGVRNINSQFQTRDSGICQVSNAIIDPANIYFSSANQTSTLQTKVFSSDGSAIQPLPGVYDWEYLWNPMNNPFVALNSSTLSTNIATAQNRNGETDIWSSVLISTDNINNTTGIKATGRAHAVVLLCERPWPPKNLILNGQGPLTILPYEDKKGNNDGFDIVSNTFNNKPIAPTDPLVGDGYFNFSTYYCADNGGPNYTDDLPYLKPVVQAKNSDLQIAKGTCEETGTICTSNNECGIKYVIGGEKIIMPDTVNYVCGGVDQKGDNRIFIAQNGKPVICADHQDANQCHDQVGFDSWLQKNNISDPVFVGGCPFLDRNKATILSCQPTAVALKRFIFTNEINNDAIGIQIFTNPKHLSVDEWYAGSKKVGGQNFGGNAQRLAQGIGGYDTLSDGNNYYVDVLNYSTTTENLYTNIYLFSINSDAKTETRSVFEQMLKNTHFNSNLTNFGYCGTDVNTPVLDKTCNSDFDCQNGQVCANQVEKIKRNYLRLLNAKAIDNTLEDYRKKKGSYPELTSGTYLKGQTLSVWPSWSVLGNAVGFELPRDPINLMGPAGTCLASSTIFCTSDAECPRVNNATTSCALHLAETRWADSPEFSFACATSSYAYRYIYNKASGYDLRVKLEPDGLLFKNFQNFYLSLGLFKPTSTHFGDDTNGICDKPKEITTFNTGVCGDRVINWGNNENCDPPGQTRYGNCFNGIVTVDVCSKNCQWLPDKNITCAALSILQKKCGNGIIDLGEACDDGKLNGTYNHCNKLCDGFGNAGFCGDYIIQDKLNNADQNYEFCEITPVGQNNKTGWCVDGLAGKYSPPIACNNDSDCRDLGNIKTERGICATISTHKLKYNLAKNNSCNFDCKSFGPYCGDGIVQREFGEECDGNEVCSVDGTDGNRFCDSSCKYVDKDVVGWWRLDDVRTENNISTYLDSSSNSLTGSSLSKLSIVNPNDRRGVHFDGQTDFITVPHNTAIMPTKSLSVEFWVFPTMYGSYTRLFGKGGWVGNTGGYEMSFGDNTGNISFLVLDNNESYLSINSSKEIPVHTWSHIVATYEEQGLSQTIKLYIDGVFDKDAVVYTNVKNAGPVKQNSNTVMNFPKFLAPSNEPLLLGRGSGGNYFQGTLSDFKIYSRALDSEEVIDHAKNAGVCQVKLPSKVLASGTCGDGVIGTGEVCDNGAQNGVVCTPGYEKGCSYCAAGCEKGSPGCLNPGCQNIISVSAKEYCGDGEINGKEVCDFDQNSKVIYAREKNATSTEQNQINGGYVVRSCDKEPQPEADYAIHGKRVVTFAKGTKECVKHCSQIIVKETGTNSCIVCGIDPKGVRIDGGVLNVLEPKSDDPLYITPDKFYMDILASNLVMSVFHVEDHSKTRSSAFLNLDYKTASTFNSNSVCSTGTPRYQAWLQYDNDPKHIFDFPIVSSPQPWQYDLVLSPVINSGGLKDSKEDPIPGSATPDNIRVVVSWIPTGGANFSGGFLGFDAQNNSYAYEGPALMPAQGTKYFAKNSPSSIWYHGLGQTAGGINEESFTIDTKKIPLGFYAFYVRSPNLAIKKLKSSAKLKVDVYLPDNKNYTEPYNYFSPPNQTFILDAADFTSTQNPAANYWQVFNLVFGQDPGQCVEMNGGISCQPGTDIPVERRIVPINIIISGPESFSKKTS